MTGKKKLILASTSPYREKLLSRLRIPFESCAPAVDEEVFKARLSTPAELVRALAAEKARSLMARFPKASIIGADQAAEIDGHLLGKPGSVEAACAQLELLSGRTHRLWTAVAVADSERGRLEEALEVVELRMRILSPQEIRRYVTLDQPLDCAGAYRFEGLGAALFEGVSASDPTAIEGLPLLRLCELLRRIGISPLED
ncbi:MAG: septum formation protein Maf [Myxococcales bacterium]|nr:septum formation protein Maf [Myxococcales bacterium]